jgi:hypothetical protein
MNKFFPSVVLFHFAGMWTLFKNRDYFIMLFFPIKFKIRIAKCQVQNFIFSVVTRMSRSFDILIH